MQQQSLAWVAIALFACAATASMVVALKYVGTCVASCARTRSERPRMLLLAMLGYIAVAGVACACAFAYLASARDAASTRELCERMCGDRRILLSILAIGAIVLLCQAGIILSVNAAPNPGYAHLVINLNVVVVLIASVYLFGNSITPTSWVGVVLAVAGIMLVIGGSREEAKGG